MSIQQLHRLNSMGQSRYHVDSTLYNERVDNLNMLLTDRLNSVVHRRSYFWKLNGFWSLDCIPIPYRKTTQYTSSYCGRLEEVHLLRYVHFSYHIKDDSICQFIYTNSNSHINYFNRILNLQ
jgi:hypothetical protein